MTVINVHLGDSLDAMNSMKENQYDLAIVDPEYGIDIGNMNMGLGKSKKASKAYNRQWNKKDWDKSPPDKSYFNNLKKISKNQIIFGGNYFDLGICNHYIIWDKKIPEGLSFSACEYAWTSFNKSNRIFRYSVYLDKKYKNHPTKKPVALYKWILKNYAKPGDKIIDTHGGSMSIAIACIEMGFDLDIWELDPEYFDDAVKHIQNHVKQLNAFIPQPEINIFK